MFRNILIPIDGSPLSRKAVKGAVRLAKEQKARVTGLYVAPPYKPDIREEMSVSHFISPQEYQARTKVVARKYLKSLERAAAAAGVRCELLHAEGIFPFEQILRTARRRKCDLIYMASHGRRGVSRLLLGSETSKVLAHSPIPVMVCH